MSLPEPTPVYIELGDHAAIEAELDRQMGIEPKPPREQPWECLAGDAVQFCCGHASVDKAPLDGMSDVVCTTCGHSWFEVAS